MITPRRRSIALAIVVFVTSLLIYRSNDGNIYTFDSAPASLFTINALERHTLAFDDFRTGYLSSPETRYIFTDAPNGHLEPIFPIGTALLAAPIYLCDYLYARANGADPDITSIAYEQTRLSDEKRASTILGALAAMLFFLCALRFSSWPMAFVATVAFSLGSDMWTVGSQALWQHGSVALATLGMILAFASASPAELRGRTVFLGGLCAGFLPVVRPTALVYSIAGIAFVVLFASTKRFAFGAGVAIGLLPGLIWNAVVFHSLIGGYAVNDRSYVFSIPQFIEGISGLLVSPNRGLLVFTPFVFFSIAGAVVAWRQHTPQARLVRLLSIASVATLVNYAFFSRWQGGSTFGPRYLTDLLPTAGLALLFVVPRDLRAATFGQRCVAVALVAAIAVSVGVQIAGANGEPKTNWSGVPIDVSRAPERIWSLGDTQILRDARATIALWTANPTFTRAYASGFDGRIESIAMNGGAPNAEVAVQARLRNTGTSPWFNCATGLFYGQVHLRIRFFDRTGALVEERYVYPAGSPRAGDVTNAIGIVTLPATSGAYTATFDLDAFQDARIGSRHVGARSIRVVIAAQ